MIGRARRSAARASQRAGRAMAFAVGGTPARIGRAVFLLSC